MTRDQIEDRVRQIRASAPAEADVLLPWADPVVGEALKAEGMARQLGSGPLADDVARIAGYIEALLDSRQEFTSDDVYALAAAEGRPLAPGRPMGAVLNGYAARGLAAPTGQYRKSGRAEAHARIVKVWRAR